MPDAAAGFSSSAALPVLHEACQRAGLSSDGAELLRLGENAIYRLACAPVVVRIARSAGRLPRVEKELCIARWLATAKVPAVRVVEEIDQPLTVNGHPVSFWHSVSGGRPVPTHLDLARLLAAFHSLPDCPCEHYASGSDMLIAVNAVLGALVFDTDPAGVDPFEQAVADLGTHLGFTTQRPERDVKRGPDDLWAFGGQSYAVIECKNAAVTDFIRKTDLDQLSGSLSWFRGEYELPASALPVMIHSSNKVHRSGTAPVGCRVITAETLPKLQDAVRGWATALAGDDQYRNPDAVYQQLTARKLNGRSSIEAYARHAIASS